MLSIKNRSLLILGDKTRTDTIYIFYVVKIDKEYVYLFVLNTFFQSKKFKLNLVPKNIIDFYYSEII